MSAQPVPGGHANPQVRAQTERLLNLLIALRSAPGWIDRGTLRDSIADYQGLDEKSFERKFSRDKALLRELGIEISTRDWEGEPEESAGEPAYGYRITDDDYALRDVMLTRSESVLLGIAAGALAGTTLAPEADRALNKLRGLGVELSPVQSPQIPGTRLDAGQFVPLMRALGSRTPVQFEYRKPGNPVQLRRLEPYALLNRGDSTYVMGRDIDRDGIRTFRLSRIVGSVKAMRSRAEGDYSIPTEFSAAQWFDPGDSSRSHATLLLEHGHGEPLRRAALSLEPVSHLGGTWDRIAIEFEDSESFVDYLLRFGPHLQVLGPDSLTRAYRAALEDTVSRLTELGEGS